MSENTPNRPRRARTLVAVALASAMVVGAGASWTMVEATAQTQVPASPVYTPAGFADLVAKVKPAVVNISTTEKRTPQAPRSGAPEMPFPPGTPFGDMFKRFFEQQPNRQPRHALGSGFIIDPTGYIVTNDHVVDGAGKIVVTLDDGSTHTAQVKGRDPKTDLALLKIDADKPLAYVEWGDSDKTRVGEWVVAVGNPFGLGGTVTAGILSAHGRNIGAGPYDDFLQFDAPINPGSSGGPVFDQSGRVIGVSSVIYSPSGGNVGIGFAVPSSLAKRVVAELREHGTVDRGWLGVQMQPLTPALAKAMGLPSEHGVVVVNVEPGSPAAKAGLQQGDVITGFNGEPVKTGRDLAIRVGNTNAGETAKMSIRRDGREQTLTVKVGAMPKEQVASTGAKEGEEGAVGLTLAPLTPDARNQLKLDANTKGVLVARVAPDSRAAESGLKSGDVIIRVGNDPVNTPDEAAAKIKSAEKEKKEAMPLLVMRDGTTYYLPLQLAKG